MDRHSKIQCPIALRRAKTGSYESIGKEEANEKRIGQLNIRETNQKIKET